MKRGTIMMIMGLGMQVINWVFFSVTNNLSRSDSDGLGFVKSILGYGTMIGWIVFFAGLGIRQLDKKRFSVIGSNGK